MSHPDYLGVNDLAAIATHFRNSGFDTAIDPEVLTKTAQASLAYLAFRRVVFEDDNVRLAWKVGESLFLQIDHLHPLQGAVEAVPTQSDSLLGHSCETYHSHHGHPFFFWQGKILANNEVLGQAIAEELLSRLPKEKA